MSVELAAPPTEVALAGGRASRAESSDGGPGGPVELDRASSSSDPGASVEGAEFDKEAGVGAGGAGEIGAGEDSEPCEVEIRSMVRNPSGLDVSSGARRRVELPDDPAARSAPKSAASNRCRTATVDDTRSRARPSPAQACRRSTVPS